MRRRVCVPPPPHTVMNTRRLSLPPPPPPLPPPSPPPPSRYRRHCRGRRRCGTHLVNGRGTFETDHQKIISFSCSDTHTHTHKIYTRVNNIVHDVRLNFGRQLCAQR
uniref:Uncharacterized protein n=1 Tax=Schizaphis graminum TaxID=13262 RepID=A0A2S2NQ94_SCHGA